nr:tryptophan--tRNA ligase [Micavibrio sp.]
ECLIQPEPLIMGQATRVMSLTDGTKKMSKSEPSEKSRINLVDDADTIAKKIKKAQTDQEPMPSELAGLEGRAGAKNLVNIYAALADIKPEEVVARHAGQMWGQFKPALAEVAVETIAPITAKMRELLAEPEEIDRILHIGNMKAREATDATLAEMRDIMGFWE